MTKRRNSKRNLKVYQNNPLAPCRGDRVILIDLDGEPDGRETEVASLSSEGVGEEEGMFEITDLRGHTYVVEKVDYDTWIQSVP